MKPDREGSTITAPRPPSLDYQERFGFIELLHVSYFLVYSYLFYEFISGHLVGLVRGRTGRGGPTDPDGNPPWMVTQETEHVRFPGTTWQVGNQTNPCLLPK